MIGDENACTVAARQCLAEARSTPWSVPYRGKVSSNDSDASNTTRASVPSTSMTMAVRLCVLESSPR